MLIKLINESYLNKEIELNGWVLTSRNQKDFSFIKLTDRSNISGIQLILDNSKFQDMISELYTGVSINIFGILVNSPAKEQEYEIQVSKLTILGNADPELYPLAKGKLPLIYLRNFPHLRFRTNTFSAIFRIKNAISFATHIYFQKNNYLHLDPNIITVNECEGGAGVFQITEKNITNIDSLPTIKNKDNKNMYDWSKDHFNKPVFLTVSSQLQLEAISCGLGAVYTTNKSFRSEHSNTHKHLSEFTHLEIENTFINLDDLMNTGENYIKFIGSYLLENNMDDLIFLNNFVSKDIINKIKTIIDSVFIRLDYDKAIQIIKNNSKIDIKYGDDLSSESENFLTEFYKSPIFVINWPQDIKSFYMKQNDDNITCSNFDLLMPFKVGELIGGSMREENYDKLIDMMQKKGIENCKSLDFYLDLRKFGSVPHGGFGLGLDRLCMLFTGIENIKDVVPFPISYENCSV